jgi:pimeloyl-ACP methyl ester carboxylesterase
LREVALEAREKQVVSNAQVEQELGLDAQTKGRPNWECVQAIIRAIDRIGPDVSSASIGVLLRDVFIYVNDGPVRRTINKIVAERLTEEPTVVVGHSLGSVVAYEVLREHTHNSVPRYVTVGSPLGIRAIRRRLTTPLTMPPGVRDWYNAYDERDVVALYALDAENFGITPAIRNYGKVNNHSANRHGIAGYLDGRNVAREIQMAIRVP